MYEIKFAASAAKEFRSLSAELKRRIGAAIVEVCLNCGMVYYDAAVLKEIERQFFAIRRKAEEPDRYIEIPAKAYA